MKKLLTLTTAIAICATSFITIAQDEYPFQTQIEARQAHMKLYSFNLGILGAMAKGETEYNAEQASTAANNLLTMATMSTGAMWPAGSDVSVAGLEDKTAAKPDIWANFPEVGEKGKGLVDALTTMAAEAGNGLDAVRANMEAVGDGCKGCHESFRVADDN
jgi:cytochrome c556